MFAEVTIVIYNQYIIILQLLYYIYGVLFSGVSSDTTSKSGRASEWGRMDVNQKDPVEMALTADVQKAPFAHVAASSCKTCIC